MKTEIVYFGRRETVSCDGRCEKAWGINSRPRVQLSDDPDDYVFVGDGELGDAPDDPGTSEGFHKKPNRPTTHNKWCVRECERSTLKNALPDMENPEPNIRRNHPAWPAAAKQFMRGGAYRQQPTFQPMAPDELAIMITDLSVMVERLASHLLLSELSGNRQERIANLRMHVFADMAYRSAVTQPGTVRDAYACAINMMVHLTAAQLEVTE